MASSRNRPRGNGTRGSTTDMVDDGPDIWNDIYADLKEIEKGEAKAAANRDSIFEGEERLAAKREAGKETDMHSALFREGVRLAEAQSARLKAQTLLTKLELLRDIQQRRSETEAEATIARTGSSRTSDMNMDGTSDSPGPSPAENRQVRKLGSSRTSSQPPKSADDVKSATSEASERVIKPPKIVYSVGDKVAFKRKHKVDGKANEETEWIQGEVSRVIGEGKSRRYEVKDPFPDDEGAPPTKYKSSASQMVPIPVESSVLEEYEIGKRVLALYPDTTTFYRAEVKGILDGGAAVQLLFEDEAHGEFKKVERRFALDHKG